MILKKIIKDFIKSLLNIFKINSEKFGAPKTILSIDNWLKYYYKTYSPCFLPLSSKEIINEREPQTIEEQINWKFKGLSKRIQPETFVLKIQDGRVARSNGLIITPDDTLLIDVSREFSQKKYNILETIKIGKLSHLKGNVAVLTTAGSNVYYHWLFDILPRIHLLKEAGIFDRIDYFIFPELKYHFQKQSLGLLNFPMDKIIQITNNQQIKADFLFVPSLPSLLGTVNQWAVDFLRNSYLKKIKKTQGGRRIYITRKGAVGRNIKNEKELKEILLVKNFEIIDTGKLDFIEQIKIFAEAQYVIAPHGSGLSNIVFCPENCTVVDIMPPSFIIPVFWILSNKIDANYYYFIGEGERCNQYEDYWHSKNTEIIVDLIKFKKILEKINL